MVGASAGPENFKTTHHKDLNLFQGSAQPWLAGGINSGIGKFIHERRDVNANTGSTGTLSRGSGFAEVDLAMDADFCGDITVHLTRAALTCANSLTVGPAFYGAPYFRDNELYESIDKLQVRHEGKVVYEVLGADLLKMYRELPFEERARWNKGMGAGMSVGERRIRASASCELYGPLILPWTARRTLKDALPLRQLRSPVTLRFYFTSLNQCVLGPAATTGGALSGLSLRQDNYHVEADVAAQVALQVARGAFQVPYLEFIRQGAVAVTANASPNTTTASIQCTNFKRHAFAIECEIEYSDHLANNIIDNVEKYCLPATYVRVLSGNKQINVEEEYTPIADCVASPVESMRYADNHVMFKGKPANLIRNVVALCPYKTFDACMRGEFNNLRALQLYQDLQVQVVTPSELALYTKGGLIDNVHAYQEAGPGTDTISATSLTMTCIAYSVNALRMINGQLMPVFSV